VVIAFVGGVFSPRYARARSRTPQGAADPSAFCAVNVALYGPSPRWAYTERDASTLVRTQDRFALGATRLAWDDAGLTIEFDEVGAPLPRALRGEVRIDVSAVPDTTFALDEAGRHRWRPIAPVARARVRLASPRIAFEGAAYVDGNDGDEPLERAFRGWHWSRSHGGQGTAIAYDVEPRQGSPRSLALACDASGAIATVETPPLARLPSTRWGVARATRADPGVAPFVVRTLEDTPFYARSLVATSIGGRPVTAMHESLSLDRFARPWVRTLLPFRMRRG